PGDRLHPLPIRTGLYLDDPVWTGQIIRLSDDSVLSTIGGSVLGDIADVLKGALRERNFLREGCLGFERGHCRLRRGDRETWLFHRSRAGSLRGSLLDHRLLKLLDRCLDFFDGFLNARS